MNDDPMALELTDAVRLYLEKELLPTLTDARQRFQTLVAANVLSIAGREMASEEALLAEEIETLTTLLGEAGETPASLEERRQLVRALNQAWCDRIRRGEFDSSAR